MLSPRSRTSPSRERSPFSSPFSGVQASPVAARRTSVEERRRPAAKFDVTGLPKPSIRILQAETGQGDEEDDDEQEQDRENEDDGEEAVEDEDEDDIDAGETSPLLPIFSAAHLGKPGQLQVLKTC